MHPKGIVRCVGNSTECFENRTIFLLPEGYRPAEYMLFATLSNGQLARITIGSDGRVFAEVPSYEIGNIQLWISLDGITFPAA